MNIEDIEKQLAHIEQKLVKLKSNAVLKGRIMFCGSMLRELTEDVDKSYSNIKNKLKVIQSKLDEFCPTKVNNDDDAEQIDYPF